VPRHPVFKNEESRQAGWLLIYNLLCDPEDLSDEYLFTHVPKGWRTARLLRAPNQGPNRETILRHVWVARHIKKCADLLRVDGHQLHAEVPQDIIDSAPDRIAGLKGYFKDGWECYLEFLKEQTLAEVRAAEQHLNTDAALRRLLQRQLTLILFQASNHLRRKLSSWDEFEAVFVDDVRLARGVRRRPTEEDNKAVEQSSARAVPDGRGPNSERRPNAPEDKAQRGSRETVAWKDLRRDIDQRVKRVMIVADPGYGKTMLLWHETGRRSAEALRQLSTKIKKVDTISFAVFIHAEKLASSAATLQTKRPTAGQHHGIDLLSTIIDVVVSDAELRTAVGIEGFLRAALTDGQCLVAIDGFDEVREPDFDRSKLIENLALCAREYPQLRILGTSRLTGYQHTGFEWMQTETWEVMAFGRSGMERMVRAWFGANNLAGNDTWQHLKNQTEVFDDLRCPLLLRLACQVAEHARAHDAALPRWQRRAEMYERFLDDAASTWQNRARPRPANEHRTLFLDLVGDVACGLLRTDPRRPYWKEREINSFINQIRIENRYPGLVERKDLLGDMLEAGLLVAVAPDVTQYMFAHRTFGEYLAARTFARRADLSPVDDDLWAFIDAKAGDADWNEVIQFLAAQLQTAAGVQKLLRLLSEPQSDSPFRHRFALSLLLLEEIDPAHFRSLAPLISKLAKQAQELLCLKYLEYFPETRPRLRKRLWPRLHVEHVAEALPHLIEAIGSLEYALSKVGAESLLQAVVDYAGFSGTVALFGAMTHPWDACRAATSMLVARLTDNKPDIRVAAAKALAQMGEAAAAHEGVLDALIARLDDKQLSVSEAAADALENMAESASGHAGAMDKLIAQLKKGYLSHILEGATSSLLVAMGENAMRRPAAIRVLRGLLNRQQDSHACEFALEVLGKIGLSKTELHRLGDELPKLLKSNTYVSVGRALKELGADMAGQRGFLAYVLTMLKDQNHALRGLNILETMGESVAAKDGVVDAVAAQLVNQDSIVREAVISALRAMHQVVETRRDVGTALVATLADADSDVRIETAWTLAQMATQAAEWDGAIEGLLARLENPHPRASEARRALSILGETALAEPGIAGVVLTWLTGPALNKVDTDLHRACAQFLRWISDLVTKQPKSFAIILRAWAGEDFDPLDQQDAGRRSALAGLQSRAQRQLPSEKINDSTVELALDALAVLVSGQRRIVAPIRNRRRMPVPPVPEAARVVAIGALETIGCLLVDKPHLIATVFEGRDDKDRRMRETAARALGAMASSIAEKPKVLTMLCAMLDHRDSEVRSAAALVFEKGGNTVVGRSEVIRTLAARARDPDPIVSKVARHFEALRDLKLSQEALFRCVEVAPPRSLSGPALTAWAQTVLQRLDTKYKDDVEPHEWDRLRECLEALASSTDYPRTIATLIARAANADWDAEDRSVRQAAVRALLMMGDDIARKSGAVDIVLQWLNHPDGALRRIALKSIEESPAVFSQDTRIVTRLVSYFRDPNEDAMVRKKVIDVLGEMGPSIAETPNLVEKLIACLDQGDPRDESAKVPVWRPVSLRQHAALALGRMGPAVAEQTHIVARMFQRLAIHLMPTALRNLGATWSPGFREADRQSLNLS
jgi:hypothetical protein